MTVESRARLVVGIVFAIVLGPAIAAVGEAAGPTSRVVNVAVPRRLADGRPGVAVDPFVVGLKKLSGDARLEIHLATGSDYEILDWMGKGLMDAAVLPTLSLYLLHERDKLDLLEIDLVASSGTAAEPAPMPRSRRLVSGSWRDGANPGADFEAAREWLWCEAMQARIDEIPAPVVEAERSRCRERTGVDRYELVMPSHLSTSGFLAPVADTARWLSERPVFTRSGTPGDWPAALVDRFWQEWFANARFTLGAPPGAPTRPGRSVAVFFDDRRPPAEPAPSATADARSTLRDLAPDHLVILGAAKAAFSNLPAGVEMRQPRVALPGALQRTFAQESRTNVPAAFRSLLFVEKSFGTRTFDFTVDESIALLRQHRHETEPVRLALVLPGGGVKAAYQSRVVEYLYSEGRLLRNAAVTPDATKPGLPVHYVIGTSGGALLGFFVARLADDAPAHLSELLWQHCDTANRCSGFIRSTDIFPFIDMPRYITGLAILVVLWTLLLVRSWIAGGPSPDSVPRSTRSAWRLRLTLTMGPVLVLTPILVRQVNDVREHIPAVEGVFYAACAIVAMCVDQCVVRDNSQTQTIGSWWRLVGIGLGVAGAVSMAGGLVIGTRAGSLLVCAGALLMMLGSPLWAYTSNPNYVLAGVRDFLRGAVVGLGYVFAVYVVLFGIVTFRPAWLSFLELTVQFWGWLLGVSVVLGLVMIGVDLVTRRPDGTHPRWWSGIHAGMQYLSAYHPNGDWVRRRSPRLLLGAALAIGWWNFIVAPALYGNAYSWELMGRIIDRFNASSSGGLTATLIVPANDLDQNRTSYFLFAPDSIPCPALVRRPGDDATWQRFGVPVDRTRDIVNCDDGTHAPHESIRGVVFASGAPFPVFPAHRVDRNQNQLLIDGGYSNLVPVDAAQTVSADAVLIIGSSSPLPPDETSAPWWSRIPGQLVTYSPMLLGFLYERSQQIDRLSRPDLLVVSIAPRREEPNWPLLTDFRPSVIERMVGTAQLDLTRRVGLVESWGRPRFGAAPAETGPSW